MAFDSAVMKVAYTVCGHTSEKKTHSRGVGKVRAFLSRGKSSGPKRVQGAYGWCPACTEYYRYDIRNSHCILNFWKFKREHSMDGAVPQTSVCGAVLFNTLTNAADAYDWPMPLEDMAGFLSAIEYKPDPVDVKAYRSEGWSFPDAEHAAKYTFAVKMRKATLEWAESMWKQNWIRIPAGTISFVEAHAPVLTHIPQHPKPGSEYPVLFDPFTRCPLIPRSRFTEYVPPSSSAFGVQQDLDNSDKVRRDQNAPKSAGPAKTTNDVCFRLNYESSSPSFVQDTRSDEVTPERRRKKSPALSICTQHDSAALPSSAASRQAPRTAPPRPSFRLAACSRHGTTAIVHDCEECKRIRLTEITLPPSSDEEHGCKSAPLPRLGEYIFCTQPLCFCTEVGIADCPTCPLRAKSKAEGLAWL